MAGNKGKILFVDLTSGSIEEELLSEAVYRDFIGGAGLGARIIYERIKPDVDPLGPENIIGFVTGTLTGTTVPMASKFQVVTKSPKTNTWGDSTSGGFFGSELKAAEYDAIFFTGVSPKPVYLWLNNGKAELKDATHLWGKDTYETEKILLKELGDKRIRIARIGPAGESRSLLAGIVADQGRIAARSGVGAVMGAKKLKAIAVRGTSEIEIADTEQFNKLRKETLEYLSDTEQLPTIKLLKNEGTTWGPRVAVPLGWSPIKNWNLMGEAAFPDYDKIGGESILKYTLRRSGCGNCPVNCGRVISIKEGPYAMEGRSPEYETLAAFGPMCLNANAESIIKANDICDRYGVDTISTGATIAFAIECYENGIIGKEETGGIELTWGNAPAIVAILNKLVKREGFGDVLADGVVRAAERIGHGSENYAIHIHGHEPAMHDSRVIPMRGLGYLSDANPGHHVPTSASIKIETQGGMGDYPELKPAEDADEYERRAKIHAVGCAYNQTFGDSGMCLFTLQAANIPLVEFISAVTGWDFTIAEVITVGRRSLTLRQAFNVREGLKPEDCTLPERMARPATIGDLAGKTIDYDKLRTNYYKAMGWDTETGCPSEQCLTELGLKKLVGTLP
jgi:aldehyde:ferredoxin oxidoreductase